MFLSIVFGTKDKDWLDLLWEAGLQVTIQVRLCSGPRAMLLARNTQSEAIKALGHPALSDSFVTFTKTVMGLGIDKVKDGEDLGLSFNGTSYNAAMHKAALSLGALFPSLGLEAALQHLELEFGREVVSNGYSKLSKLIAVTKQSNVQSPDSMSTSTLADKVSWLVEMLSLVFKLRIRLPSRQQIHGWIGTEKLVLQDSGLLASLFWRQEKGFNGPITFKSFIFNLSSLNP